MAPNKKPQQFNFNQKGKGLYYNPLSKYFRQPGITVHLPSGGRYSRPGDMDSPEEDGTIPVYPMTAADEIIIKNPDSLLNGSALERLIISCVPHVKNPKTLPICDADVLMMAIKASTYGDTMDLPSVCPSCKENNMSRVSIERILCDVKPLPEEYIVELENGISIYLAPYTMETNNKINLATFEETKALQALVENKEVSDIDRVNAFTESFAKMTNLNIKILSESILRVSTPDGDVDDRGFIAEFMANVDRSVVEKIREGVKFLNEFGMPKKVMIECDNEDIRDVEDKNKRPEDQVACDHQYEAEIVYDPVSFFATSSSQPNQETK